ncbi:MAG: hypothetical protein Q8P67_04085 [archaeon]|nr:hypothetical protein [archaeon]
MGVGCLEERVRVGDGGGEGEETEEEAETEEEGETEETEENGERELKEEEEVGGVFGEKREKKALGEDFLGSDEEENGEENNEENTDWGAGDASDAV